MCFIITGTSIWKHAISGVNIYTFYQVYLWDTTPIFRHQNRQLFISHVYVEIPKSLMDIEDSNCILLPMIVSEIWVFCKYRQFLVISPWLAQGFCRSQIGMCFEVKKCYIFGPKNFQNGRSLNSMDPVAT